MVRVLSGLHQPVFGEEPREPSDGHAAAAGKRKWQRCGRDGALARPFLRAVILWCCASALQHPFIKTSKPISTLRTLISDAMEIKLKRQEEAEQRDQDGEDEDNSVRELALAC